LNFGTAETQQTSSNRAEEKKRLKKPKETPVTSKAPAEDGKLAPPAQQKDNTALSMQSGMSSSLVETSEDEEAKKLAEKAAKKAKRGLSTKELEAEVDVEINETETMFFLHIPSRIVAAQSTGDDENEEISELDAAIKRYEHFLEQKKGSDNYTERGSQTMNLTQKTREVANRGFMLETKEI